jgi:hypothetical protein
MKQNKLKEKLIITLMAAFISLPILFFFGCPTDTVSTETSEEEEEEEEKKEEEEEEEEDVDPDDQSWQTGQIKLVDEPESDNFFDTAPADKDSLPSCPPGYEAAWCYFEAEPASPGPVQGPIAAPWVEGGHRGKGIDLDNGRIHTQLRFTDPVAGHAANFDFSSGAVTLNTWIYWRGAGRATLDDSNSETSEYNTNEKNQVIFSLSGGSNLLKLSINDDQAGLPDGAVKTNAIIAAAGKLGVMAKVAPTGKAPVPLVPDREIPKNEWHMVTLTFDGSEAAVFLDGKELLRQDCTAASYWGEEGSVSLAQFSIAMFRIGGSFYGPPSLNAIIDDASYWKTALPGTAIKSMWYATKGGQ